MDQAPAKAVAVDINQNVGFLYTSEQVYEGLVRAVAENSAILKRPKRSILASSNLAVADARKFGI